MSLMVLGLLWLLNLFQEGTKSSLVWQKISVVLFSKQKNWGSKSFYCASFFTFRKRNTALNTHTQGKLCNFGFGRAKVKALVLSSRTQTSLVPSSRTQTSLVSSRDPWTPSPSDHFIPKIQVTPGEAKTEAHKRAQAHHGTRSTPDYFSGFRSFLHVIRIVTHRVSSP